MRRLLLSLGILAVTVVTLAPIPKPGEDGSYNPISRLAYCRTRNDCVHEIGHALDQQAGWISQSDAFADALTLYVLAHARLSDDRPVYILTVTYGSPDWTEPTKRELYAYLFRMADGKPENMPDGLREFYDWDRAAEMLTLLDSRRRLLWLH